MSRPAFVQAPSGVPAGPGLDVVVLRADEQDVLVVVGEADLATATALYAQLLHALPAPPRPVVVELGALAFCDLSGLDALRDVQRSADAAGVPLTFRGCSAQLQWLQRFSCDHHDDRWTPGLAGAAGGSAEAAC